jgi:hypothetical protein
MNSVVHTGRATDSVLLRAVLKTVTLGRVHVFTTAECADVNVKGKKVKLSPVLN